MFQVARVKRSAMTGPRAGDGGIRRGSALVGAARLVGSAVPSATARRAPRGRSARSTFFQSNVSPPASLTVVPELVRLMLSTVPETRAFSSLMPEMVCR